MSEKKKIDLTESEWNVCVCLWESAPMTARALVDALTRAVGWSRSTTLTLLRRMTEKGLLSQETDPDGVFIYSPLVAREDAEMRRTRHFLDRVWGGSVSMMVSAMTDNDRLSAEEIDALYAVLRRAEEKAKKTNGEG